jgi:hypothetical protein
MKYFLVIRALNEVIETTVSYGAMGQSGTLGGVRSLVQSTGIMDNWDVGKELVS